MSNQESKGIWDIFVYIIFSLVGIAILSSMVYIIYSFTGSYNAGIETIKEKTPVYSVDTQKDVTGSFTLGYGEVGTEIKYYVYQEDGDEGKILENYDASKTHVKDTLEEGQESYIETQYKVNYIVPSPISEEVHRGELVTYKGKQCVEKKEFISDTLYVPKGYIKKQIDLNIK